MVNGTRIIYIFFLQFKIKLNIVCVGRGLIGYSMSSGFCTAACKLAPEFHWLVVSKAFGLVLFIFIRTLSVINTNLTFTKKFLANSSLTFFQRMVEASSK